MQILSQNDAKLGANQTPQSKNMMGRAIRKVWVKGQSMLLAQSG